MDLRINQEIGSLKFQMMAQCMVQIVDHSDQTLDLLGQIPDLKIGLYEKLFLMDQCLDLSQNQQAGNLKFQKDLNLDQKISHLDGNQKYLKVQNLDLILNLLVGNHNYLNFLCLVLKTSLQDGYQNKDPYLDQNQNLKDGNHCLRIRNL